MKRTLLFAAALAWVVCLCGQTRADVKPHVLFADNMVLQQGKPVPVWGTADDGEEVTVKFQNQEQKTTAQAGKWMIRLNNLKAGGPFELSIVGKNAVELKNVLVGEVWIASGQSNMEMSVRSSADAEKNIANSKNPKLRLFTVPKVGAAKPATTVNGKWSECGPDTVPSFSAVAYFFGRDLQKARDVPVGIIHTSWGGTPAEAWTSKEFLAQTPETKHYIDDQAKAQANFTTAREQYQAALEKHKAAVAKAKDEGKNPPPAPRAPGNPLTGPNAPCALYNGMIAPLIPYAFTGAIWYQGESNARGHAGSIEYRTLFPTMIESWRAAWKQGDFPFLFVQLAPFMKIDTNPSDTPWAWLREAQLRTTNAVKNAGMAVITDVGDERDIHPKKKEPVGARLALAALGIAYGEKIVYSGPIYESMKVAGNKAVLSFKSIGGGLVAKGDSLAGFTICGDDKKFYNAAAKLDGDKVVVMCDQVDKPVAVRFGWANYPVVNLWNQDGLPASPFRTDDFPPPGAVKKAASTR